MQKFFLFFFALSFTVFIACRKRQGCTDKCAKNYVNARNDDGSCQYVKPSFDYAIHLADNCKPPYHVYFYSKVSNVSCFVNYKWNFGDGETSTYQNPIHLYGSSGIYHVSVSAVNGSEETIDTFTMVLDTLQPVVANFDYDADNDNYRVPAKINFFNYFNFAGDFYWDFGDGITSTEVNPSHIYTNSGSYKVSLKSSCGSRQAIYSKTVNILPKPSIIALTAYRVGKGTQDLSTDKGTPLYMEMLYNSNSQMFSKIYLFKSYPATWYFPDDIANGNYKVYDNFFNSDFFTLNLWIDDIGPNDKILYWVRFNFQYLSNSYYPPYLSWDANGYKIEAWFKYQ